MLVSFSRYRHDNMRNLEKMNFDKYEIGANYNINEIDLNLELNNTELNDFLIDHKNINPLREWINYMVIIE